MEEVVGFFRVDWIPVGNRVVTLQVGEACGVVGVSIINTSSTPHASFLGWNCGKFLRLPSGMDKIRYKIYPHTQKKKKTQQATVQHSESCGSLTGVNKFFINHFHIYCSLWVKILNKRVEYFAVQHFRVYCKSTRKEQIFLTGTNKMPLTFVS